MTTYPDRQTVIDVLAEAARTAALDSTANHPEDIACSMVTAIEGAAVAIEILWKKGKL